MGDFRKFAQERARLLGEGAAAELTREVIAATSIARSGAPTDAGVSEAAQDWPGPLPDFLAAPPPVRDDGSLPLRTRLLRDPGAGRAEEEWRARYRIYPEHWVLGALWMMAMGMGLWCWMA